MAFLKLQTYRFKNINAYLVSINDPIEKADYGSPETEKDADLGHRSKSHAVIIDLSRKPDGGYKYKEAVGHKSRCGFLHIAGGEIAAEYGSEGELLKAISKIELPELEGSDKQINWASQIREKFVLEIGGQITDWSRQGMAHHLLSEGALIQAKAWIDNRDRLKPEKFVARVKQLEAENAAEAKAEALANAIDKEESDVRVVYDDEALVEVDLYAIVYSDRIEVVANQAGMADKLPRGRKYIGSLERICWEYNIDRIADIENCQAIQFILAEDGRRLSPIR
jgi:hypothetical protein